MEVTRNLLILVIDMSPAQKYVRDDPKSFFSVVDTIITFANIHRMLQPENEVAVISSDLTQRYVMIKLFHVSFCSF